PPRAGAPDRSPGRRGPPPPSPRRPASPRRPPGGHHDRLPGGRAPTRLGAPRRRALSRRIVVAHDGPPPRRSRPDASGLSLNPYHLLARGPPGPDRAALEATSRRLGHAVPPPDPDAATAGSPAVHDLVVLDARSADAPAFAPAVVDEPGAPPVLVVA